MKNVMNKINRCLDSVPRGMSGVLRWLSLSKPLLMALTFAFVFASCSDLDTEDGGSASVIPAGNQVAVRITVDEAVGRTAFPDATRDNITIFVLSEGETELGRWTKDWDSGISAYKLMQQDAITLTAGTHTLTLTGCTASSATATDGATYIGTLKDVTVAEGTVLNFTLSFIDVSQTGTGSASIYYDWPRSWNSNEYKVYALYKTQDRLTPGDEEFSYKSSGVSNYSDDYYWLQTSRSSLSAGYYIAVLEYYADRNYSVLLGKATELVYVTAGIQTTARVRLEAKNSTYTITYNFNGGSFAGMDTSIPQTKTYSLLQDVTLYGCDGNGIVSKPGYTFGGWYVSEDFDGEPITGWKKKTVAKDVTLYAKWDYTVTFNANDTEEAPADGTMENVDVLPNTTIPLTKNAFTREGYLFTGWNTQADGAGTHYDDCAVFTVDANVTLYAEWLERTANTVAITFRTNGGKSVDIVQVPSGTSFDAPETTLIGHDLVGWFTTETFTGDAVDFATYAPTEDAILWAKWTPHEYTITYYDYKEGETETAFSGDSTGYPETHTYGTATELPMPEKDGFSIGGWYTNAECTGTTVTELSADGYTKNITLYAKWLRTVYYVSAASGDDDTATGAEDAPYKTIGAVLGVIAEMGEKANFKIVIDGEITENVSIADTITAASITICGDDNTEDILNGGASGAVLTITAPIAVTLQDITITNGSGETKFVGGGITLNNADAVLTLADGALITGNKNTVEDSNASGGVFVTGTLIMEDGAKITNNSSMSGAGVFLYDDASEVSARFIMNGGEISNNTASKFGGGVAVCYGLFTMNDGTISGNTASGISNAAGGGVYVYENDAHFIMNGGTISGNTAAYYGGGVYNKNVFTMKGGTIADNSAENGGGVYTVKKTEEGLFTIHDGTITGNEATYGNGGGIFVTNLNGTAYDDNSFTMTGGTISSNTASSYGGGVYTANNSKTIMSGGTISKNEANRGGGVYNNSTFTLNGGTISENKANYGGGVSNYRTCYMNDGTISENEANYGGGVYNSNSFYMTGGTISGNTANTNGGAVYQVGTFEMSGSAYIPAGAEYKNDVYLLTSGGYKITVNGTLTAQTPVATISLQTLRFDMPVLKSENGVTLANEVGKFAISPKCAPAFIKENAYLDTPTYAITYKDKGGEDFTGENLSELPATHQYGITTTLVSPVRTGYEFVGWYTDSDCFGTAISSISETQTMDDITLYARWTKTSVSVDIQSDVTIAQTEKDGVITLTAADGYTDYLWLISNKAATSVITDSSVSADGKTFTFDASKLTSGMIYVITVSALNENGLEFTATVRIKK